MADLLDNYDFREPVIENCRYREALQAVRVEGGVANNVVPDSVTLLINHRYAPDRSVEQAEQHVRDILGPCLVEGDLVELVDHAPAAVPGMGHPLLTTLADGLEVRGKLGWTDVAFFSERNIPAVNFGPGDATLAHTSDERVERSFLELTYEKLRRLLSEES